MSNYMFRFKNIFAGLAVAGLAAGCGGGVSTVSPVESNRGDFNFYRGAASDGVVHVAVAGQVENVSDSQLKAIVTEQFGAVRVPGPVASYSNDPADIDWGGARFVVAFNPTQDLGLGNVCDDDAALAGMTSGSVDGELRALAAFCNGSDARTWVRAKTAAADTVALEAFVRRVARDVIPEPVNGADCENPPC